MRSLFLVLSCLFALALLPASLHAQDAVGGELAEGPDDNGFLINLLQDKLSTENRKIRLSGIDGLLSSAATVKRITISDPEGIWLQIDNAAIDWNRSALLRGRVEVNTLAAETIRIPRKPLPDPSLPEPSAEPFSIPELPVSVSLSTLKVDRIVLGEPVLGMKAEISAEGSLSLIDAELKAALELNRLDGPGGRFALDADIGGDPLSVAVTLEASEPAGGVFASLLDVPGRPAMDARIVANGTLDDLLAEIDFTAGGADLLDGRLELRSAENDTRVLDLDLTGRLQPLLPPAFHGFFAEESVLDATARQRGDGSIILDRLAVNSGGLSLFATLSTAPDGFPQALELTADLARGQDGPLVLPVGAGDTSIEGGSLRLSYGNGAEWSGKLALVGLVSGDIAVEEIDVDMGGVAENLNTPDARRLSADIAGIASGFAADDPGLQTALGSAITLAVGLDWSAGNPLQFNLVRLDGKALDIGFSGRLEGSDLSGRAALDIEALDVFAALAGRDLSGAVNTSVEGSLNILSRAFDLSLDGTSNDLRLGIPELDPFLVGETTLQGRITRDSRGIEVDDFRLGNQRAVIEADGIYAQSGTDFTFSADLDDIARMTQAGRGAVSLTGRAVGGTNALSAELELAMPQGELQGRALRGGRLNVIASGRSANQLGGTITGRGALAGTDVALDGRFSVRDGVQRLQGVEFTLGRTQATATVARGADGLIAGTLDLRSPDISEPAALALADAQGALEARIILSRNKGTQSVSVAGSARDLAVAGATLQTADIDIAVRDIFGVPLADGRIEARGAAMAGQVLQSLDVDVASQGTAMRVGVDAALNDTTRLSLTGGLENLSPGIGVDLETLRFETDVEDVVLIAPSRLEVRDGAVTLSELDFALGEGRLTARGVVGEMLDLSLLLEKLPLRIANALVEDLGLAGSADGTVRISGTTDAPSGSYDLSLAGVSASVLAEQGLPPLDIAARGQISPDAVTVDGRLGSGSVLAAALSGTVPIDPKAEDLDVGVDIELVDLSLLDRLAGNLGLVGRLTGTLGATGSLEDPRAEFDVLANDISVDVMRSDGLGAVDVALTGGFADQVLTIERLRLDGIDRMEFEASGAVPLTGSGLDIRAQGRLPLELANILLARSQSQLAGVLQVDVTVNGRISDPQVVGTLSMQGGTFVNAPANLRLNDLSLAASIDGTRLTIREADAAFAQGGRIAVSGTIDVDVARGIPADLQIRLRDAFYTDGKIVTTQITGDLGLSGPILGAGLISGNIRLDRTEVTIPSSFGINAGVLLDVTHQSPPRDVVMTLERAGLDEVGNGEEGSTNPLRLDVDVNVPNQLFVRGRGMDAELGGRIRVRGTVSDVQPVGAIQLIRGRLSILGQRFDFDEGTISLTGDLNPRIRLVAETDATDDTTVLITVAGQASDPEIIFSSSPDLPQDEVLALLIFNRNLSDLSAFQVAQLAAAAATLSGGGGNGLVGGFRSAVGLADLDLTSDEEGEVGVRAGAYLDDNIYLDVEADSGGDTKATINLDITTDFTARASVDSQGESTIGIFFEKDY